MNHEIHEIHEKEYGDEREEENREEDVAEGNVLYREESYAIVGACFAVYKEMGVGFLEAVYEECLEREFAARGIPYRCQAGVVIDYKGAPLEQRYVADFVCFEKILIEIKVAKALDNVHRAQIANYLRATGARLGLLVNFGHYPLLEYQRFVADGRWKAITGPPSK